MSIQRLILIAFCVYLVTLGIVVFLTRPIRRRCLGALAGGLAVAVVGVGVEVAGQTLGFWHYPDVALRTGPPAM